MKWSETARKEAQNIYDQIIAMPFVKGLIEGTLDREKFNFYLAQDALYLEHFSRALSLISARAHDKEQMLSFIRFAENAIAVESQLHEEYLRGLDTGSRGISPACHHYSSFLLSTAALAQVEVGMAAVLPCFWIYKKTGDYILQQQKENNPYQNWIDTYSGEEFTQAVKEIILICDKAAAACSPSQREKMTDAFLTACKLEWMFWDSAWRLEKWPE